jgi:signal transduction histidine kinase
MAQEKFLPALALALPLVLLAAGSWVAWRDAEHNAEARLADLTQAMAEHAERAFDVNETVLHELERTRVRGEALHELLTAICERLPHIRAITIRNAEGYVLVTSGSAGVRPFRESAARRGGGFTELALEPAYFLDYYSRLARPEDEVAFRIAATDGRVLAQTGVLDPGYRASRTTGPILVTASQSRHAVLQPWLQRTFLLAALALPSAAALLFVSLLVLRRTRRLHEQTLTRSGVAHDFNNVLAVIGSNAYLLRHRMRESAELAAILRAVDSGARLTRQLLSFARRQPLNPQILELQQALPEMAELLASTAGTGVPVGIHVAPDTPRVCVDRAELEMALINLAANARDAMHGRGQLEILARGAEPGEGPDRRMRYAIISVSDSGEGISPKVLARVFDPFFTTKPLGSGTGLGLAQVHGFCEQAGGGVQLESDVGVGTTVSLFLPQALAVSDAIARRPSSRSAEAA